MNPIVFCRLHAIDLDITLIMCRNFEKSRPQFQLPIMHEACSRTPIFQIRLRASREQGDINETKII